MRAGSLNKYVNFLKKTETSNSIGALEESYEDIFNQKVPVSIRDVQTTEKYFESSILSKTELIISMRFNSLINEDLLVSFENRNYEIIKVNNIYAQNKQLLIAVKGFDFE